MASAVLSSSKLMAMMPAPRPPARVPPEVDGADGAALTSWPADTDLSVELVPRLLSTVSSGSTSGSGCGRLGSLMGGVGPAGPSGAASSSDAEDPASDPSSRYRKDSSPFPAFLVGLRPSARVKQKAMQLFVQQVDNEARNYLI